MTSSLLSLPQKNELAIPNDEPVDKGITAKQKGYLNFLATMIQNDRIRQDLLKRLNMLSRSKAAKIIDALVSGDVEDATSFF